jgi:Protein of unknown function (DUF2630)
MTGMDDSDVLNRVKALVDEEHRLRSTAPDPGRLAHVEEQLDQCWDLLRQRRARRDAGENPDAAAPRSINEVEHYQQ